MLDSERLHIKVNALHSSANIKYLDIYLLPVTGTTVMQSLLGDLTKCFVQFGPQLPCVRCLK